MHYNRIFKTMYTFYQAFMTTKCSLVYSSKYYSLCLERWHAKVKKLHRNRVFLRTERRKTHWNLLPDPSPTLETKPLSTKSYFSPPASFWTQTDLRIKMPGSSLSPQVSLARLIHLYHHFSHLQNWDNVTHTLGVSEDKSSLACYRSWLKCHLHNEAFSGHPSFFMQLLPLHHPRHCQSFLPGAIFHSTHHLLTDVLFLYMFP